MRLIRLVAGVGVGLFLAILVLSVDLSHLYAAGIIFTIMAVLGTWILFVSWRKTDQALNVKSSRTLQHVDITHENQEPPAVLHPTIQTLHDMGFRRLGEEVALRTDDSELARSWVFVDSDEQVTATLVPLRGMQGGVMAQFQTVFPGPAWLRTIYPSGFPYGETITLPDFWVRNTRRSLVDAHDLHRAEMASFGQQHGEPVRMHTVAETLSYGPIFRERHLERFLRRNLLIPRLSLYFLGGMTVLFIIGTVVSGIVPALAILIFVLGFSALFLFQSFMVPTRPRVDWAYRSMIGLSLLLLPLSFMWHLFVLIHFMLLAILMIVVFSLVSTELKTLTKEIESGQTDINWQVPTTNGDDPAAEQ